MELGLRWGEMLHLHNPVFYQKYFIQKYQDWLHNIFFQIETDSPRQSLDI